jgi:glucosamine-6-phosphate deaminase
LNIVVDTDHDRMSHSAAESMLAAIARKPDCTILVATGNTPIRAYSYLAELAQATGTDLSRIRAIQLDEYLDVGPDDPRSLFAWMDRAFLTPLGVSGDRVIRFDASSSDHTSILGAYDAAIESIGGIDLAILGLGPNGHLGFNEPPSRADAPSRVVDLTAASLASNAVYWGESAEVPHRALTCGMAPILASREILLLVSGAHKADILRETIKGEPSPGVPSSLLQLVSDRVTIHADDAAWGDRGST